MFFYIPIIVVINAIILGLVYHTIIVVIQTVVRLTRALQEFVAKKSGSFPNHIRNIIFVPAVHHIEIFIKIGKVILPVGWTANVRISPHAKDNLIKVLGTFIGYFINKKYNIFCQGVSPLVVAAFNFNTKTLPGGVRREWIIFKFFVAAVIHNKK